MNKELLKLKITAAFKNIEYPGNSDIVYDNNNAECEQIRNDFIGKKWEELDIKLLQYNNEALTFFSPSGFQYFLPAYLMTSIERYNEAGNITFNTLCNLIPPSKNDSEGIAFFNEKISNLNKEQNAAILAYLYWIKEEHPHAHFEDDIDIAIKYWDKKL